MPDKEELNKEGFSDAELERYSRQLLLPEVDIVGQERLQASHVLIVGAGGLGNPVALYLAAAGVGRLTLLDDDRVELSNLARQIGFRSDQIGLPKVQALATTLAHINPSCHVETRFERVDDKLNDELEGIHLVLDCSDNFATRFAVNRACVKTATPLISGAAIRLEGQVAAFDLRHAGSPCYCCLFDEDGESGLRCSEAGVLGPVVGLIGSFQAFLAVTFLVSDKLPSRLWRFDGKHFHWRELALKRDLACPACGS
jgi:adenylyltransferase/sulfurtransferase